MMTDDDHDDPLYELAQDVIDAFTGNNLQIATAESCTGGMIAASLTDIAGSSAVVDRGFVTYSNEAKAEMLGVDSAEIDRHGAVSSQVANAMAEGALARSNADIAISVTGIAGPDGGSDVKPVGLVWFACACGWAPTLVVSHQFEPRSREFIRYMATMFALEIALKTAEKSPAASSPTVGNA